MKKILLVLLLLFSIPSFAASNEIVVSVKGMVCAFCAQGITKKFKAEPSISKVDVSLEKKTVTLDLVPGQNLADSRIETILKDAGYNVEKIEHH
jgi:mercuric ion binding protein